MIERELRVLIFLGGLAWSCVSPAEVDEEGTGDGNEAADSGGDGGTGATGLPSDTQGSGGTQSQPSGGGPPMESTTSAPEATGGSGAAGGSGGTGAAGGSGGSGAAGGSGGSGASAAQSTDGQAGAPATDDICPFDGELEYDPHSAYPFCEGTEEFVFGGAGSDAVQSRCRQQVPGSDVGLGRTSWSGVDGSPDGEPVRYCLCMDDCESASDCPAGDTGNAQPACIEHNLIKNCYVTCDDGETCPDGMTCTQSSEIGQRVCAWRTRGDGCDTSEWPHVKNPEP